jgi:Skp family chaperone for outer membrane proteins
MKTAARLLATLTMMLLPSAASAQTAASANLQTSIGLRVACFSPQRAFSESADGKTVLARLAALEAEKARVIDEKNKALQAQQQALEQTSPLLTEVVRTQRSSEVEKFRIDVQRFIEDARAELMGIQRDAESAFVIRLKPAVAKVAQEKGLQLVFNVDDGPVAWFDASLDITSDIVKQLALK